MAGIAYTLLSGAEVPTVRSLVAALLVLAGLALGREAMTLRLVAAGALAVLLLRPEALAGPSFKLSFAAVTAIIAFHEHPRVRAFLLKRDEVNEIARVVNKEPVEGSRRLAAEIVERGQPNSVPHSPSTIARALTGRGLGR